MQMTVRSCTVREKERDIIDSNYTLLALYNLQGRMSVTSTTTTTLYVDRRNSLSSTTGMSLLSLLLAGDQTHPSTSLIWCERSHSFLLLSTTWRDLGTTSITGGALIANNVTGHTRAISNKQRVLCDASLERLLLSLDHFFPPSNWKEYRFLCSSRPSSSLLPIATPPNRMSIFSITKWRERERHESTWDEDVSFPSLS